MVLIYGEILLDVFKNKDGIKSNIGGAPFNVYYTISKLKGNAIFVGNVGNDEYGNSIRDIVAKCGLNNKYITLDPNLKHQTTIAYVELDENNERSFKFNRNPGADSYLFEGAKYLLEEDVNIIHLGSLMLSNDYGRKYALDVIKKAKKRILSFDVNYRDDIFKNKKKALKIYNQIIDRTNIVKYSKEEVLLFANETDFNKAINKIARQDQHIFVTLGKDGSLYYHNGKIIEAKSIEVTPVDTTGAGDAFYATILYYIDSNGFSNFFNNDELIKKALQKANIMGAYATLKEGALSNILSLEELEK